MYWRIVVKKVNIKLFNYLLMVAILLGTLLTVIFAYLPTHTATYMASIPLVIVPFILNKTIFKMNDLDQLVYYLFVFFGYFLGSVVNLYNTTEFYDLVIHFSSGLVTGYFAIFVLKKLGMYDKNKRLFNFIFCLFFTIGVAGIWEILEFTMDQLTGSNLQHHLDTGVRDTMEDMICGTLGGLIFSCYMAFKNRKK